MSLLLNGAKTMTIAGTEMQCLEIYTGEAYTFPITFTDTAGNAANCNGWSISADAKFYTVDNIVYNVNNNTDLVNIGNINYDPNAQPSSANYTLEARFANDSAGTAFLYVGDNITNSGNGTPNIALANSAANSTLVIVTLNVSRPSDYGNIANVVVNDINREPLGFIVRYQ